MNEYIAVIEGMAKVLIPVAGAMGISAMVVNQATKVKPVKVEVEVDQYGMEAMRQRELDGYKKR